MTTSADQPDEASGSRIGLCFSGALLMFGIAIVAAAVPMRIGTLSEPGPGFFPVLGGGSLIVLAGCDFWGRLWHILRSPPAMAPSEPDVRTQAWKAVAFFGTLAAYVAVLNTIGFIAATFLLALSLLYIANETKWWVSLLCALVSSLGAYALFDRLLGVNLAKGTLPGLLW